MPKVFITDEVNDSRTVDVLPGGSLKSLSYYSWVGIPSGTGSGVLLPDGQYILHSVIVGGETTGKGLFTLGDHVSAEGSASTSISNSASALCRISGYTRQTHIFDIIVNSGLQYRLSGLNTDGIIVTYYNLT